VAILSNRADGARLCRLAPRTVAGLVKNPPRAPVWWVGRRADAVRLREAGLRISRPVPAEDGELVVARLVPSLERRGRE